MDSACENRLREARPSFPIMLESLELAALDWSQYVKIDTSSREEIICGLTDDYETRLREVESLMQMTHEQTGANLFQQMAALQEKYNDLEKLFDNIDKLEVMVAKIKSNMDEMDRRLSKEEATIPIQSQSKSSKVMPFIVNNAMSLAEAGATSFLVNSSHLLGDGVWTTTQPGPAKSEDTQQFEIFKTAEYFPPKS